MTAICMYFQVHQPRRLRRIQAFRRPADLEYWDDANNRRILDRAAAKCYLPTNALLLELIERTDGWFRAAFSVSGVLLEALEEHRPDVLQSFQALADTGHVEFLNETYYHSLAGLWDDDTEFRAQIELHQRMTQRLFGQRPTVFRNTELIYDDRIARTVSDLGYKGILTEGTERVLGARSPNRVYQTADPSSQLRVLLKNYLLSDDIAFRFATPTWTEFPLTADKYAAWLAATPGETVNLFMDYETFGEHQWQETGIFEFVRHLPEQISRYPHLGFALPSEVVRQHNPVDHIEVPHAISWADAERDVSAWLHNKMQHLSFQKLRDLEPIVRASGDERILDAWRALQTSDHLYYQATKGMGDGDIHQYFSPYESPYLAFINHVNAIENLRECAQHFVQTRARESAAHLVNSGALATNRREHGPPAHISAHAGEAPLTATPQPYVRAKATAPRP